MANLHQTIITARARASKLVERSPVSIDLQRALARSDSRPADWTPERGAQACQNYLRFLLLIARHPGQPHAPTRDIDLIWHLHMQSPKAYYEDCMRLFGEILDHDGGFGQDAAEEPQLRATFEATSALWENMYGEPYVKDVSDGCTKCWHDCQGRCWHACSSKSSPRRQNEHAYF